jgi:hypothetical protein
MGASWLAIPISAAASSAIAESMSAAVVVDLLVMDLEDFAYG